MSSTQTPRPEDRWVMPPPAPPDATAPIPPASPARRPARLRDAATPFALALAALLLGGGIMYAVDHHANANTATPPAAVAGPNGLGGATAPGGAGVPGGPIAGEQHVQGTVTAKTATTVTVKSASGTATYTVDNAAQIVRNGQTATLSAIQVGDPVLVHVYPSSSGQLLVERLFAGTTTTDPGQDTSGQPGLAPSGAGSQGNGLTT